MHDHDDRGKNNLPTSRFFQDYVCFYRDKVLGREGLLFYMIMKLICVFFNIMNIEKSYHKHDKHDTVKPLYFAAI